MKLHTQTANISRSEQFGPRKFRVASDLSVLLGILRSDLYPIPIKTIVQEIGANGRDAHREVGTPDRPIEVTLPTTLNNNTFIIRDFGPSITPDRLDNVYMVYGESTKRDSNDQTGGFGLGAKTPLAYVDSFNVISITFEQHFEDSKGEHHENCFVRREYICYIDESNVGDMPLVSAEITDEPQGTSVIIPVKQGDERHFRDWVIDRFRFWSVRPVIRGDKDFEWPEITKKFEGEGWYIIDSELRYNSRLNKPTALIDETPYPIDTDLLQREGLIKDDALNIFTRPILLSFNTGDLPVAVNRDDIRYTDRAKKVISERLVNAYRELQKICNDRIAGANNLWEANIQFMGVQGAFNLNIAEWNGIPVDGSSVGFGQYGAQQWMFTKPSGRLKGKETKTVLPDKNTLMIQDDNPDWTRRPSRARLNTLFTMFPHIRNIFVVRLQDREAILGAIGDTDKKKYAEVKKTLDGNFEGLENKGHFSHFGAEPLSNYAKMRMPRGRSSCGITQAYMWSGDEWEPVEVDEVDADSHYVIVSRKKPIVFGDIMDNSRFSEIIEELDVDGEIYGVPARFESRFEEDLEPLQDAIDNKAQEIAADPALTSPIDSSVSDDKIDQIHRNISRLLQSEKLQNKIQDATLITDWVKASAAFQDAIAKASTIQRLAGIFRVKRSPTGKSDVHGKVLKTARLAFEKRYPMLGFVGSVYHTQEDAFRNALAQYINQCNAQNNGHSKKKD